MPEDAGGALRLVAAGDALIGRPLTDHARTRILLDEIKSADVAFANMEVLIHEGVGYPSEYSGGTHSAMPPIVAEEMKAAGFNLLARANNHAMDYGLEGMISTTQFLDAQGLKHAGVGMNLAKARMPVYLDTPGARVGLLSISSTCPPGSRAGHQRPDVQGRPGMNGLRYVQEFRVTKEDLEAIRRVSRRIGWEGWKDALVARGARLPEADGVCNLLGKRFVAAQDVGTTSSPHADDVASMIESIDAARRQSNFVFVSLHAHEHDGDLEVPARFLQEFARACIDAGAHAVLGHGPHVLRGIEIYKGAPIFYSLGNFIYHTQTMPFLPADTYEQYGLDVFRALPADVLDARLASDSLRRDARWWACALATCEFEDGQVSSIRLAPVELGQDLHRGQQGTPGLARGDQAEKIISDLARLSQPFGTRIVYRDDSGHVDL